MVCLGNYVPRHGSETIAVECATNVHSLLLFFLLFLFPSSHSNNNKIVTAKVLFCLFFDTEQPENSCE